MSRVRANKHSEAIPLNSNTLLSWLADFEECVLPNDDVVRVMQYLIDERLVWGMGQSYVRFAEMLIAAGFCLNYDTDTGEMHGPVCMCLLDSTSRGGGCP